MKENSAHIVDVKAGGHRFRVLLKSRVLLGRLARSIKHYV